MVLGICYHVCWFTAGRPEKVREELLDTLGGLKLHTEKQTALTSFTMSGVLLSIPSNWRKQEHMLLFFMP